MARIVKKLVSVLAAFLLTTRASMKNTLLLPKQFLYMHYLFWFKKNKLQTLINLESKINTITPVYILKLGFKICLTSVRV